MKHFLAALAAALVLSSPAAAAVDVDHAIVLKFGANYRVALCISHAEDPNRGLATVSPTNDHGLFQIHVFGHDVGRWIGSGKWRHFFTIAELHTLAGNLRAASILSNHGLHWKAWTTRAGCGAAW